VNIGDPKPAVASVGEAFVSTIGHDVVFWAFDKPGIELAGPPGTGMSARAAAVCPSRIL